jgi:uncharacterized protein
LARQAAENGFEVMLHMPMESSNGHISHPGIIRVEMDAAEIADMTARALEDVPGVEGINNHTGSYFTETEPAMRAVFELVKARELYFVDSRTSASSIAPALAQQMDVPVAVRDVFLDNENDYAYIAAQFEELIAKAKFRGYAVGIAHFRRDTFDALVELLPRLAEEDIELVHASELVQ